MRYKFLFTIFVSFFIAVFLALGFWQVYRLNWKNNLIDEINSSLANDPVNFESKKIKNFQKIKFNGKIDNENLIYLYGLSDNGEPGFNLIKEIEIEGENFLINQGWIPRDLKGDSFDLKKSEYLGITKLKSEKNYWAKNGKYCTTINHNRLLTPRFLPGRVEQTERRQPSPTHRRARRFGASRVLRCASLQERSQMSGNDPPSVETVEEER